MANDAPANGAPRERTPSEAESVIFDERGAIGEQRLTRQSKLRRALFAGFVTTLAVAIVLGLPGAVLMRLRSATVVARTTAAPPPPATFAAPAPQPSRVPPDATTVGDIQIQPVNGLRDMGYACWIAPRSTGQGASYGPVHLSLTTDAGQHWQPLPLPAASASFCAPVPDSADPTAALVTLIPPSGDSEPCPLPQLFLTLDRGQRWQRVPWPPGTSALCGIQLTLTAHRVYAWEATPLLPRAGDATRLITTPDAGGHWSAIGAGLARNTNPRLIATRPNGWLLAQTDAQNATPPGQTELWQSADGGGSWQRLGPIPGTAPTVLLSLDPTTLATTSWGHLYALNQRAGTADASGGQIITTTTDALHWQTIPPPPDTASVTADAPTVPIVGVGLGPGDTLLATRELNPGSNVLYSGPRQLWRWDPARGEWRIAPYPIPADALVDGLAWQQGQPTLWLTLIKAGVPPSITLALDAVAAQSS